jgi:hypothetical protein
MGRELEIEHMDEDNTRRTSLWRSIRYAWRSPKHVGFSILLMVVATVALHLTCWPLGAVTFVVADAYLGLLLWCATVQSAHKRETWPGLPMRESAVVVVPLMFVTLVLAFAAIYDNWTPDIHSKFGSVYRSLINLASFTYDTNSASSRPLKTAMAAQLLSGVLLLICALPLLVSRLTDLDTPDAPKWTAVRFSLSGKSLTVAAVELVSIDPGHELRISLEPTHTDAPAQS